MPHCFVTGATGLIGRALIDDLVADGYRITALSRRARSEGEGGVRWLQGDPAERGDWMDAIAECDSVVHLAGEPIAEGRWTAERKRRLVSSRVESTRRIAEAIRAAGTPPSVWVSTSAVGYYGPRGEEKLDEDAAPGDDFLARLCVDWEAPARAVDGPTTRVVTLRVGIVLARSGGALEKMLPPFRLGLGGPVGPPSNWFPWVHVDDVVGLARFALEHEVRGAVNAVAPGAVRMGEFAKGLGRALGRPAFLPVPLAPLRLVLGEFADHLSPGTRVVPAAAERAGYPYRHPELAGALRACVG